MAVIKFDTSELSGFLKNLAAALGKNIEFRQALAEAGDAAAEGMKERTRSGRDIEHKPFVSYKSKDGKKGDLCSSGRMLDSIEAGVVSDTEAIVGIFDPVERRKAIAHQLGLGKLPRRRFFGLSDKDTGTLGTIVRIFASHVDRAVERF